MDISVCFKLRPWHEVQAIAHTRTFTCANQEKGKAHLKLKLHELMLPMQNYKKLNQNSF